MGAVTRLRRLMAGAVHLRSQSESQSLALGKLLSWECRKKERIASLADVEFKVFSQFGDDGIIQWLVHNVDLPNRSFIEFGVENYRESNTRFLMMNDNWSGFVMDGSEDCVSQIVNSEYYWRHDLRATCAFIDCENINALLASSGLGRDVGLLHIDLDGNDYWIWKAIDAVDAAIVLVEYNSVFGSDRPVTIPYEKDFVRSRKHHSHLYWGTSLPAIHRLAQEKGYAFVGCNSAGNNAYFVRRDKLNDKVREVSLESGFVASKYRESRDESGRLTYVSGARRAELIRGLPVHNVATGLVEPF